MLGQFLILQESGTTSSCELMLTYVQYQVEILLFTVSDLVISANYNSVNLFPVVRIDSDQPLPIYKKGKGPKTYQYNLITSFSS
jgi:hypothetical protein